MTNQHPRRLIDIDWSEWKPIDRATLLFVRSRDEVLLIQKKRGLGAGKINAPGGRIDSGETPLAAALRETREEVRVDARDVRARGELRFQFVHGYTTHAYVFVAFEYDGIPTETEEAIPIWYPVDALPFSEMWTDDVLWLPGVLAGRSVDGRFVFDGEVLIDQHVSWLDDSPLMPPERSG